MSVGFVPSGRLGWKRHVRLTREYEFEKVKRHGRCVSLSSFVLCYSANGLSHPRFGFVVSRRLGKATVRNKVRRWLREVTRNLLPSISGGWDIVFIARRPALDAGYEALQRAVWEALAGSNLLVSQRASSESTDAADKGISGRRFTPIPGGV